VLYELLHRVIERKRADTPRPGVESLAMLHTSRNDGREGVAAFVGKRPPQFEGRVSDGMPSFYPWW